MCDTTIAGIQEYRTTLRIRSFSLIDKACPQIVFSKSTKEHLLKVNSFQQNFEIDIIDSQIKKRNLTI